jgi:spore coat protein A
MCPHGAMDASPRTVVHLHGGHVPEAFDGSPDATFLPGQQVDYAYPNQQLPAALWYHDHALGITRLNVMMGLAGLYLLRDPVEQALGLPSGEYEIPLVLQDRSFAPDGSLRYPAMWHEHFFGDAILVNGKVWPFLQVKRGKYRFRIANASNSRTYRLRLSNGASYRVIGTDGGLLPAPVFVNQLALGPGERADVIIDFAPFAAGSAIVLTNDAPAPFPGSPGVGVVPNVLRFNVSSQTGHTAAVPLSLRPLDRLLEVEASVTRTLSLRKSPEPCTGSAWFIDGLGWNDITEFPRLGTTEIWSFANHSGVTHPMHLHLVMFQVLDRQPFDEIEGQIVPTGPRVAPPASEAGWKDTVQVGPHELTRVIARFEDFTGRFAYHCHILEHEDHAMMRQFETTTVCGDGVLGSPAEECDDGNLVSGDCCSPTCSVQPDSDGDGLCDPQDRCPFWADADQSDTDGDGRGDACECGDQNLDGRNDVVDLIEINRAIFNPALATPLCDANGDELCNVADIVAANAEIYSPGSTSTCARQPVPGP